MQTVNNKSELFSSNEKTINEIFATLAADWPDMIAVEDEHQQLTYRQLDEKANQMAHYLMRHYHCGPDKVFALLLDRTPLMIVSILAVLKSGSAYLPLSPETPVARINLILEDSSAQALLTDKTVDDNVNGSLMNVNDIDAELANHHRTMPQTDTLPQHLAYVIYTSGSTGKPKGVMIEHRQLSSFLCGYYDEFGHLFTPDYRSLSMMNISFDVFVSEIFIPLAYGSRLVLASQQSLFDVKQLAALIFDKGITFTFMPPSLVSELTVELGYLVQNNDTPLALKQVWLGVEAVKDHQLEQLLELNPNMHITNVYGPTETTISCTAFVYRPCGASDKLTGKTVTIGKAIKNTEILLLDEQGHIIEDDREGELYITGDQVARGYINREQENLACFSEHPNKPGVRMYRSGDIARWYADGNIHFIGRKDNQVKIRGFRVELGEIEQAVRAFDGIVGACVVAKVITGEEKQAIAYYVARHAIDENQLQQHIEQLLPAHMIPAFYCQLDQFELTKHHKIDRAALPDPLTFHRDQQDYDTDTQTQLAKLVKTQFVIDFCHAGLDFFALGMHSLLGIKFAQRISEAFNKAVSLKDIYSHSTLTELASFIDQQHETAICVADDMAFFSGERPAFIPLSQQQQQIWFLHQLNPAGAAYHFQFKLHISGKLDKTLLSDTFATVICRHEIYRTTFEDAQGYPGQTIHTPWYPQIDEVDLRDTPEQLDSLMAIELQNKFDFKQLPMVNWKLYRLAEEEYVLLQYEHHFLHDGVSFGLLLKDIKAIYSLLARGENPGHLPQPSQYADYTLWQNQRLQSEGFKQRLVQWTGKIAGFPATSLIEGDFARPKKLAFAGSRLDITLETPLQQKLEAYCRHQGSTLFSVMFSAFSLLVNHYNRQDQLLIGTAFANRTTDEEASILGMLVNNVVIGVDIDKNGPVVDFVQQIQSQILDAQQYQDIPLSEVVNQLKPERRADINPLSQLSFSFHDSASPELAFAGLTAEYAPLKNNSAKFDINVVVIPRGHQQDGLQADDNRIEVLWEYNATLFTPQTIKRMLGHYVTLLTAMVNHPVCSVNELSLLDHHSTEQLNQWQQGEVVESQDYCLHQLFEQQAQITPDALAVVCKGYRLSYQQLNQKANQLARVIRDNYRQQYNKPITSDTLIGLYLDRSVDTVIAILAVLKVGAAYVPIDTTYPEKRVQYMLQDSQTQLVVSTKKAAQMMAITLKKSQHKAVLIVADTPLLTDYVSTENLDLFCSPADLAYVIYTSGTTGSPKGVMVEHQSVTNLINGQTQAFDFTADERVLWLASYIFDASVEQLFLPLLNGASLTIVSKEDIREPATICKLISEQSITHLHATPGYLMALGKLEQPHGLKRVISGGESCLSSLQSLWQDLLINEYGPTETTVTSVQHTTAHLAEHANNIGKPVANTQIYVLNEQQTPVAVGVPGELYIGGAGVARGYLNQQQLTLEKFIDNPFGEGRLYRTGDLVSWQADGTLVYQGRIDDQVKIRGFRIELGEIRSQISELNAVQDVAVTVWTDTSGDKSIAAYVVFNDNDTDKATTEAVSQALKTRLPDYMLPSAVMRLNALPRTANGKVDLKALPKPASEQRNQGYVAPQNQVQQQLALIWQNLLEVAPVGLYDNFFELGGHSLKATRLINDISRQFGLKLEVMQIFDSPSLIELASDISVALVLSTGDQQQSVEADDLEEVSI